MNPSTLVSKVLNDVSELYYDDLGNQLTRTHPMWESSTKLIAYFIYTKYMYQFLEVKPPAIPDVVPTEDGNKLWLPQRANTERKDS